MSATAGTLKRRLAKLEDRRRRVRRASEEYTEIELARRVCWLLNQAARGEGGPELLAKARRVSELLLGTKRLTPEQIAEAAERQKRAGLKHAV